MVKATAQLHSRVQVTSLRNRLAKILLGCSDGLYGIFFSLATAISGRSCVTRLRILVAQQHRIG